jgi:surface antigen
LPGVCINTTPSSTITDRLAVPKTASSAKRHRPFQQSLARTAIRRQAVHFGLIAANVAILAVIMVFVLQNPHTSGLAQPVVNSSATAMAAANPLDQVSSADIALTVARLGGLPETTAVSNQAQTQAADIAVASSDDNIVSKPQVAVTALKSRADIQTYTTQPGDTIASLATKFGITSDSIMWSNNLTSATVAAGTKLTIPPVTGIVYTVKAGDTPASLAAKFSANQAQIVAYNDAEIAGLQPGEQIIIPGATQQAAAITAADITGGGAGGAAGASSAFPWGGSAPIYGSNGYDYGYCTWYVATQIAVPANWGNAATWSYYAALSGWNVSSTPTVGAIAQRGGGEGHVAIVQAVNPNGTVTIRDMNGFAGWGRVGVGTLPTSTFQYITH